MLFQHDGFTVANRTPYHVRKLITDIQRLVQANADELDLLAHFLWDEAPTEVVMMLDRASGGAYTLQVARPFVQLVGARARSAVQRWMTEQPKGKVIRRRMKQSNIKVWSSDRMSWSPPVEQGSDTERSAAEDARSVAEMEGRDGDEEAVS